MWGFNSSCLQARSMMEFLFNSVTLTSTDGLSGYLPMLSRSAEIFAISWRIRGDGDLVR